MRLFLLGSSTPWGRSMEVLADKAFGNNRYDVHAAENADDLRSMMRLLEWDAALVIADKGDAETLKALGKVAKADKRQPTIVLYRADQPSMLFNIINAGKTIPLAWHDEYMDEALLQKAVETIVRATRQEENVLDFGVLKIDRASRLVTVNEIAVNLTGSEYDLLEYLATGKGALRSKEGIILSLYGSSDESPDDKIVDVFICKVRDKLNSAHEGLGNSIQTVWGQGYKFVRDPLGDQKYARRFGPLEIDYTGQQASIDGKRLDLTITEFMILKALAFAYPNAVTIDALVDEANKFGRQGDHETVERALNAMRRKLETSHPAFHKPFLRNERNEIFMNLLRLDPQAARKIQYDIVSLGPFRVNRTTQDVLYSGRDVDLTRGEYRILNALIDAYPNVQRAQDIINVVDQDIALSGFNVLMGGLRHKLEHANEGRAVIHSKRGIGYSLDIDAKKLGRHIEERLNTFDCGPLRIDYNRKRILARNASGSDDGWVVLDLSATQIKMAMVLIESYPFPVAASDLVSDEDAQDDQRIDSLFVQLKTRFNPQLAAHKNTGVRKTNGAYRLDLDPDDIPAHVCQEFTVTNIGPWTINHTARFILFDGDPIAANDSEFLLMETMAQRFPEPCSKEQLAELLYAGHQGSLAACIMNFKKKLRKRYGVTEKIFHNLRGFGLALNVDRGELDDEQVQALPISAVATGVEIDHGMRRLVVDGKTVDLSAAEYFCLNILASAKRPCAPQDLSDLSQQTAHAWGPQALYFALTVSLQQKLGALGISAERVIAPDRRTGFYMTDRADIIRANDTLITQGRLTLNVTQKTLEIRQTNVKKPPVMIKLLPAEIKFLKPLIENPGRMLLIEDLARLSDDVTISTLKNARSTIERKLLDSDSDFTNIIDFIYKSGYFVRFDPRKTETPTPSPVRPTTPRDCLRIESGRLTMNTILETAVYDGVRLDHVKGVPFDILAMLAQSPDQCLTYDELVVRCFGPQPQTGAIDRIHKGIVSLRHMLDKSMPYLGQILIMQDADERGIRLFAGDPYERFMALVTKPSADNAPVKVPDGKQPLRSALSAQAERVFHSFEDLAHAMGLLPSGIDEPTSLTSSSAAADHIAVRIDT